MTKFVGRFFTGSVVAAALAFSLSVPSANAQGRAGQRLQSMQHLETRQIAQGVRNGSLTKNQAKNLENHMSQLDKSIAADKANGKLTPQEMKNLKNETNKIARAINGAESKSNSGTATMPPTHQ